MQENSLKVTIAVILGSVILIGGIVLLASRIDKSDLVSVQDTVGDSKNIKGKTDANIVIVEFSDFQCPACQLATEEINKFVKDYSDKVKFIYRHMPLSQHPNAKAAAYAAEAAAKQNKFWEIHDWLFGNQGTWENASVNGEYFYSQFGEKFGLNKDQFLNDYKSDEIRNRVAQDSSDATRLGITSTPTFFINGKKQPGVISYEDLLKLTGLESLSPTPTPVPQG